MGDQRPAFARPKAGHPALATPKAGRVKKKSVTTSDDAADSARVGKLRTLIRDVYTRHNPKKLEGLDQLLDKHLGLLEGVYAHICKKYGEEAVDVLGAPERTEVREAGKTAVIGDCESA